MSRNLLGTPQDQVSLLLSSFTGVAADSSVRSTYPLILGIRCPRCNSGAGVRCRTPRRAVTHPHAARIEDAVALVAHLIRMESGGRVL